MAKLTMPLQAWQQYIKDCDKSQHDRMKVWAKGHDSELPSIKTIGNIGSHNKFWELIKSRMIIARLWDYFFNRFEGCDLNQIRLILPEKYNEVFSNSLDKLKIQQTTKDQDIAPLISELNVILTSEAPKSVEDEAKCRILLDTLRTQQLILEPNNTDTYFYHLMQAYYHVFRGELEESIENTFLKTITPNINQN